MHCGGRRFAACPQRKVGKFGKLKKSESVPDAFSSTGNLTPNSLLISSRRRFAAGDGYAHLS